jgi:hypothetical protein
VLLSEGFFARCRGRALQSRGTVTEPRRPRPPPRDGNPLLCPLEVSAMATSVAGHRSGVIPQRHRGITPSMNLAGN